MPLSVPTYGATYDQTEQGSNAATVCGYVDDANAKIAALKAWITAVENILEIEAASHPVQSAPAAAALSGSNAPALKAAYATLIALL